MTVLRIYDPPECDEQGVPLDWVRCRRCRGSGRLAAWSTRELRDAGVRLKDDGLCVVCNGHGSLKAAVLAGLDEHLRRGWRNRLYEVRGVRYDSAALPSDKAAALDQIEAYVRTSNDLADEAEASFIVRCEGCWHPMGEGTWDGEDRFVRADDRLTLYAEQALRDGIEPDLERVHYSPCDEECDHESTPCRYHWASDPEGTWEYAVDGIVVGGDVDLVEASWRQVDIRTLGWVHDLNPGKLAVLCLRCLAAR